MPTTVLPWSPMASSGPAAGVRSVRMTVLAAVGLGLCGGAWLLLAAVDPRLFAGTRIGPGVFVLLGAIPIVVGSLARVPVGMLTDRYGARVVLPAVCLVTAVPVLAFARAGSITALIVAGCLTGIGGAVFPAAMTVVARHQPSRGRGLAAGVLGAAMLAGVLVSNANRRWFGIDSHRTAALVLAVTLVGYAAVAAVLLRHSGRPRREPGSAWRTARDVLRLPAGRRLAALYAVTTGALTAFTLALPAFLATAYDLSWADTVAPTLAFICVAVVGRALGGWLADREDPAHVLTVCGVIGAVLAMLLALHPVIRTIAAGAMFGLALCVGIASGVSLALLLRLAPAHRIGTVTGVVGGVGALGGALVPLCLHVLYQVEQSHAVGLTVLAGLLFGLPVYLRSRRGWTAVSMGPPAGPEADAAAPATTVAVFAAGAADAPDAVRQVAQLATRDELVVVYGAPAGSRRLSAYRLLAALRSALPRHTFVAVLVDGDRPESGGRGRTAEYDLVREMIEAGTVPVVVTAEARPYALATELAERLAADRVMRVAGDGPLLRPLWRRSAPVTAAG